MSESVLGKRKNPPKPTLCQTCHASLPKYTCPRCSHASCSLPCSKKHKEETDCSGLRNKAEYVGMNEYGYGEMMNDYTFLEDVGRVVRGAGEGIGRGRFDMSTRERGRDKGKSMKRNVLKAELEKREITLELVPAGMERGRMNTSGWDFKTQKALLTIELVFHPTPNPLHPNDPVPAPYKMIRHRVLLDEKLSSVFPSRKIPDWVQDLIQGEIECVLRAPSGPEVYWRIDTEKELGDALKWMEFVEFPTIELYEKGSFKGRVVDPQTRIQEEEEEVKRRRVLGKVQGKERISGLVGDYGSESEEEMGLGLEYDSDVLSS